MNNSLSARDANNIVRFMNDCFVVCPCCSRWVTKTDARSIFDFSIRICKRCAEAEKGSPTFNWILETGLVS